MRDVIDRCVQHVVENNGFQFGDVPQSQCWFTTQQRGRTVSSFFVLYGKSVFPSVCSFPFFKRSEISTLRGRKKGNTVKGAFLTVNIGMRSLFICYVLLGKRIVAGPPAGKGVLSVITSKSLVIGALPYILCERLIGLFFRACYNCSFLVR